MSRPIDPRLLSRLPACRRLVAVLVGLQVIGALLTVAQATLLADAAVRIFGGSAGARALLGEAVTIAAVMAGRAAVAAFQEWLAARASMAARAELRGLTLDAIVRLGPHWSRQQPPGRLVTAAGGGLEALDGYLTRAVPALVSAAVVPGVVLARIAWADWQSGAILVVLLPLVPVFMAMVGTVTKRHVERQYAILERIAGHFLDLLRGLTTLRIYGRAAAQERTVRRATETYRVHAMRTLRVAFLSGLVLDLLAALSVAVVAVDIGLRLASGHVAFETALLVLILTPELFAPLRAMGAHHHAAQEGAAAAGAALDIIDEAARVVSRTAPDELPRPVRAISLDDITVGYPGRTEPALAGVCLDLRVGEVTALTGASGSGKSTVLQSLLGFTQPESGSVVIVGDGGTVTLADLEPDAWRTSVAWLPQRPRPSQSTVAEEVRLGAPAADDVAVTRVCRTCRTPAEHTELGEDGRSVSAGERRRVALARVLLRARSLRAAGRVPVVLLDEPSEDLDPATESVVAAVIDDLRNWAVVVVATHSPVIAGLADQHLELGAGRVLAKWRQEPDRVRHAPVEAPRADPSRVTARTPRTEVFRLRDVVRGGGGSKRLVLAASLAALAALFGLGLAETSMWLISRAAQHPNVQALAVAVVGVRTFAIGRALLRYGERLAGHDVALRMLSALRLQVFAKLRVAPARLIGDYGRGDLLRRFVADVDGVQEGLVRAVLPGCAALVTAVSCVGLVGMLAPVAAVWLAAGLLTSGLLVPLATYRFAARADELVRIAGDRDRRVAELVDALEELVAYGAVSRAVQDVRNADAVAVRAARRPAFAAAAGVLGSGLGAALTMAGVLCAAAAARNAGQLSAVNAGVLVMCVLVGFEAVGVLPAAIVAWARCRAGLDRVAEVAWRVEQFAEPDEYGLVPDAAHGLLGQDLSLAPASGERCVIQGSDFELLPGRRVALVGPSGCGKSTLLAAVLRLLNVQSGRVAITSGSQQVALSDLRADDVPPVIAGSLQGDHVFDVSLRDNLRFVRPEASDEELDDVARRVGLLEDIRSLPGGWSTAAGPDGSALSGGQRQRLLLARALVADPSILVLDEPTAHLDADLERSVLTDLFAATDGRTILLTSHRSLPADQADDVLRIDDRRIRAAAASTAGVS